RALAGVLCGFARRLSLRRSRLSEDLVRPLLLFAAERVPEVTQPTAEGATNLRQPLGPEHQQRDHENEQQMCWLKDVADHNQTAYSLAGRAGGGALDLNGGRPARADVTDLHRA